MSPLARTDELVGYRQSNWDTPWWASSNLGEGRYHRLFEEATQYLCLHPLGVAAELLRHLGRDVIDDLDTVHYRLWAARVPREGLVRIQFQTAEAHGIAAEDLVGDAYGPTQSLADRLRGDGVPGAIVPSAALPGTENVVLFGPRIRSPYLVDPPDPADQIATAHAGERCHPPRYAAPFVRWLGDAHAGLTHWLASGETLTFANPAAPSP